MMGQINLASLSLDTWQPVWAKIHTDKAQNIVAQLNEEADQRIINTTQKYRKVTYTTNTQIKNYDIPIIYDVLMVSDYDNFFNTDREHVRIENDASVVDLTIILDLREVKKALQQANKAIENEKYDEAQTNFENIFKNSILSELDIANPLLAIHDNLALAKALFDHQNYGTARIALKLALKQLRNLEKNKVVSVDAESVKDLESEITQLQEELLKKDPTTITKAKQKLNKSWQI